MSQFRILRDAGERERTHQRYSSSVSPFQAKTGTPVAAMAAAAWSWVEKICRPVKSVSYVSRSAYSERGRTLHDDQVTRAPRAVRVSMRTALLQGNMGVKAARRKVQERLDARLDGHVEAADD